MQSRTLVRRRMAAILALPRQKGRTPLRTLLAALVTAPLDGIRYSVLQAASYNTGLGAGTLALNTAQANTASGVAALILNTAGTRNTANGAGAMVWNSAGNDNSWRRLFFACTTMIRATATPRSVVIRSLATSAVTVT